MSELNKRTGGGDGAEYEVITQTVTVDFVNVGLGNYKWDGTATMPNPFGKVGGEIELYGGGTYGGGTMAFFSNGSGRVVVHYTGASERNYQSFYMLCVQDASYLTLRFPDSGSQYWPTASITMTLAFLMKK